MTLYGISMRMGLEAPMRGRFTNPPVVPVDAYIIHSHPLIYDPYDKILLPLFCADDDVLPRTGGLNGIADQIH